MAFAGLGPLTGLANKAPRNAAFCIIVHMLLNATFLSSWKIAVGGGFFFESIVALILPQSPPQRTLAAPVEVNEAAELGQSFVEAPKPAPPVESGVQVIWASPPHSGRVGVIESSLEPDEKE